MSPRAGGMLRIGCAGSTCGRGSAAGAPPRHSLRPVVGDGVDRPPVARGTIIGAGGALGRASDRLGSGRAGSKAGAGVPGAMRCGGAAGVPRSKRVPVSRPRAGLIVAAPGVTGTGLAAPRFGSGSRVWRSAGVRMLPPGTAGALAVPVNGMAGLPARGRSGAGAAPQTSPRP